MNFFKSVFTPDPDPDPESSESEEAADTTTTNPDHDHDQPTIFMGFMKTLATTSESVIQTYRRDLEEFGSGFKKETEAIREAAVRAVRDLPVSIEAKAQSAIDALLDSSHSEPDANANAIDDDSSSSSSRRSFPSNRLGRLQLQLHALQSDPNTFVQDPQDLHDFRNWKQQQQQQIPSDNTNTVLSAMLDNLVPDAVDYDTFWTRYLYKVHKLKQADNARAMLVKRVIAREEDDEDLTWEVDDDDDQQQPVQNKQTLQQQHQEEEEEEEEVKPQDNKLPEPVIQINEDKKNKLEIGSQVDEKLIEDSKPKALSEQKAVEKNSQAEVTLADEDSHANTELQSGGKLEILDWYVKVDTKSSDVQIASEGGNCDNVVVVEDTKISAVSTQTSEEEIGWDEIEDLGDSEEKKVVVSGGSPKKAELRKKLIVAEEDDEDLSWDIEDD